MASKKFVDTPQTPIASPPANYKGGPGVYNGENAGAFAGYKRTSSPNAAAEKTIDGQPPMTTDNRANPAPKVNLDFSKTGGN